MQKHTPERKSGFTLLEALAYAWVSTIILGLVVEVVFLVQEHTKNLSHVVYDIKRTINFGEMWREEVRASHKPPVLENEEMRIFLKDGKNIVYKFSEESVWKQYGDSNWEQVLVEVKSSKIFRENRQNVIAWRWELELQTERENPQVRPLFTFLAVSLVENGKKYENTEEGKENEN